MRRLAFWSLFAAFQVVGFLLLWYGTIDTMPALPIFAFVLLLPGSLVMLLPFRVSGTLADISSLLILGVNYLTWYLIRRKGGRELPF